MKEEAIAFAPASVGNIGVGFDILGHTIEGPGDRVIARRVKARGVQITSISGAAVELPKEAKLNTAGAAILAMIDALQLPFGFEIELHKGIAFGSGMGGSAASAVAALVAANELLDEPLTRQELYPFALAGETVASGSAHGDNVGSQLLGGVVLSTADRVVRVPVPAAWHCVLVHPDAVLETRRAREVLKQPYALHQFVEQSANLALLLTACYSGDASLLRGALNDVLVEPRRSPLIPGFDRVKKAALENDAIGASISGAGPSIFAWFETRDAAVAAVDRMIHAFATEGIRSEAFVSPVAGPPAEVIR